MHVYIFHLIKECGMVPGFVPEQQERCEVKGTARKRENRTEDRRRCAYVHVSWELVLLHQTSGCGDVPHSSSGLLSHCMQTHTGYIIYTGVRSSLWVQQAD